MCFIVDELDKKEKIAKDDIICYKVGRKYNKNWIFRDTFLPLFRNFTYKIGKLYKKCYPSRLIVEVPEFIPIRYSNGIIYEGFHSYKSKYTSYYAMHSYCCVLCIIPKGAKYYENKTEYVSDQIIIKKLVKK